MLSREAEAKRELERFLRDTEKMSECRGSYLRDERFQIWFGGVAETITEFKGRTLEVRARDLTEADKLNGVEFAGVGILKAGARRRTENYLNGQGLCWGEWAAETEERYVIRREN